MDGALKQKRSAQMTIEWLGLQTAELAGELSKGHQWLSRQQMRVAATAFEKKLHASRTAGKVDLANQSAEMEGIISSRVQERLREMSGAGAADTYRRLEETAQELLMARYKAAGLADAVGMTKEQLKASEAAVAELRKERSVCEAVLDTALRELEGHAPMVATLEERVHELARASRHQHSELEGAKVHITTALLELDVAVDENRTLAEQVQAIVQRLRAAQAHVDENAALHAEAKRLRERVAALEAGEDLRAARERLATLELERQQCDAELDAAFAELAGMQTERDGAGPRLALRDDAFLSDVAGSVARSSRCTRSSSRRAHRSRSCRLSWTRLRTTARRRYASSRASSRLSCARNGRRSSLSPSRLCSSCAPTWCMPWPACGRCSGLVRRRP